MFFLRLAQSMPRSPIRLMEFAFAHGGNDRSGIGKGEYATKFAGVRIAGDDEPFDPRPLLGICDIVILWGANHYADKLLPSPVAGVE